MTFTELRKKHGFTQAKLAEQLGVDQSTVSLWEKGKTAPSRKTANRLAELFKCTVDDLFKAIDSAVTD